MIAGLLSFSASGVFHKLADVKGAVRCDQCIDLWLVRCFSVS